MGQIIGGAAKPKRCNLHNLSSFNTPAAGEFIIISSDNSMNEAGQGRFDCYVVGDGSTAASSLLLQTIEKDFRIDGTLVRKWVYALIAENGDVLHYSFSANTGIGFRIQNAGNTWQSTITIQSGTTSRSGEIQLEAGLYTITVLYGNLNNASFYVDKYAHKVYGNIEYLRNSLPTKILSTNYDGSTKIVSNSQSVGSAINIVASSYSSNGYVKALVKKGEKIRINSNSLTGVNIPAYAFTDLNLLVVEKGGNTPLTIDVVAPNDGFVFVNVNVTTEYAAIFRIDGLADYEARIANTESLSQEIYDGYLALEPMAGIISLSGDMFETGNLDGSTGQPISASNVIRTKDFITSYPNASLTYSFTSGYRFNILWYGADYGFKGKASTGWLTAGGTATIPSDAKYIKFVIASASGSSATPVFADTSLVVSSDKVPTPTRAASEASVSGLDAQIEGVSASVDDIRENYLALKDTTAEIPLSSDMFERGTLNWNTGETSSTGVGVVLRTKDYIEVGNGATIAYSFANGLRFNLLWYDSNHGYIGLIINNWITTAGSVTLPSNAKYIKILIANAVGETEPPVFGDTSLVVTSNKIPVTTRAAAEEKVEAYNERITYTEAAIKDIYDNYLALKPANGYIQLTSEMFEGGNLDGNTGLPISSDIVIRSINPIPTMEGAQLNYSFANGYRFNIFWYDKDNGFIGRAGAGWFTTNGSAVAPVGTAFIKFVIASASGSSTAPVFEDVNLVVESDKIPTHTRAAADDSSESFVRPIYAPSPQLPANADENSDFNAETITTSALYAAYDSLVDGTPKPASQVFASVGYANKNSEEAFDASGVTKLRTYVFTRRNRYAWKSANKLFAWKTGSTIYYIDSCSPRIGDAIYSDVSRTLSGKTVSSYTAATSSLTTSDSQTLTRDSASDVAADIVWSKTFLKLDGTDSTIAVFNREGTSIGTASVTDTTHISINNKTYERCESQDYHTDNIGTIFLWANEHGPQSDPYEPAIILYRLAEQLCHGSGNDFISFLKNYYKVVLLPVANPWGMDRYASAGGANTSRNNYNGVNINRNYNTIGWASQSDNDKGSYAGDQPETQYIMNQCVAFDSDVAIDIHCLSYTTANNEGRCHYEGYAQSDVYNEIIKNTMLGYGLGYTSYGNATPDSAARGCDWLYAEGISGGLIEMNAGDYASAYNGKQHSGYIVEADFTLLLNTIRLWMIGTEQNPNFDKYTYR